jgi:hypothetical protein
MGEALDGEGQGMRERFKTLLSWLVVALGSFIGLLTLALLGWASISPGDSSPEGYQRWFGLGGLALLGLGFLLNSLFATRNRRSAGIRFLIVMPVVAFCVAYANSGTSIWRDGTPYFETPLPATAIGLAALFYAPFLALLWMPEHAKRAAVAFTLAVSVAAPVFARSRWTTAFLPPLAGFSAPFLLAGLFWLLTGKFGWAPLLRPRRWSLGRRILAFVMTLVGILCLDVVTTLTLSALGSSLFNGDCRGRQPFVHPLSASHAVFTAKVLFAGRSLSAMFNSNSIFRGDAALIKERSAGDWALGVVKERFWGLPGWTSLVLLRNYIYWDGETYFIDGYREGKLLTRLFPIVEGGIGCSRTRVVQEAAPDLRLLHKPPPEGHTRIIGSVRGPDMPTPGLARPVPAFALGARINVTGPSGTVTVTTDSSGVYELDDLAPGDYTVKLVSIDDQAARFWESDGKPVQVHLNDGGIVENGFWLLWNGSIEGHVKDDAGNPAYAELILVNTDDRFPVRGRYSFQMSAKDGSYRFREVPPGRYIVKLNPEGPHDRSPYDLQYYPEGVSRQSAKVFDLAAGQKAEGADFQVSRLKKRRIQVRVIFADGTPGAGAHVSVAYENTNQNESWTGTNWVAGTDQNGLAVIHTYGRSKVRLFAEKAGYPESFSSQSIQLAADQTPDRIDLVLVPTNR